MFLIHMKTTQLETAQEAADSHAVTLSHIYAEKATDY